MAETKHRVKVQLPVLKDPAAVVQDVTLVVDGAAVLTKRRGLVPPTPPELSFNGCKLGQKVKVELREISDDRRELGKVRLTEEFVIPNAPKDAGDMKVSLVEYEEAPKAAAATAPAGAESTPTFS